MKKIVCFLLIVMFLCTVYDLPSFARSNVEPNIVANYQFTSGTAGWSVFGTGTLLWENDIKGGDDPYLALSHSSSSWASPYKNIYDIIKANGPGTYTINAKALSLASTTSQIRMILRTGQSDYSFSTNSNGFASIGIYTTLYNDRWSNISGSFKIRSSDIESDVGTFNLCFDGLSYNSEGIGLCLDEIVICKMNEDNITNGSFNYGLYGWRTWGDSGYLNRDSQIVINENIYYGKYICASTYGSIACNVDQIMAKHDKVVYDAGFALYLSPTAYQNLDKMVFYLTSIDGGANCYIGQRTKDELCNGWSNVSLTIDSSETLMGFSNCIYDELHPDTQGVVLRMEYRISSEAPADANGEYGITNVYFVPPNSFSEDAEAINLNQTKGGNFSAINAYDIYAFTPTQTTYYNMYVSGNTETHLKIYDASYALLYEVIIPANYHNRDINFKLNSNTRYILQIKQNDTFDMSQYFFKIRKSIVGLSNENLILLKNEFNQYLGSGKKNALCLYNTEECLDIIYNYDNLITSLCSTCDFWIPKPYMQALLLRELWCVNSTDTVADQLVESGINDDSSTGLAQIFAKTAIGALNNANAIGINTGYNSLSETNREHVAYMWNKLHNDSNFNLTMMYYEILNCARKKSLEYEFFYFDKNDTKAVLSRYNGTGEDATTYGNEVYEYYLIFEKYLY